MKTDRFFVPVTEIVVTVRETLQECELVPWEGHEVPIGALFKASEKSKIQRITGFNPSFSNIYSPAILLDNNTESGYRNWGNYYFTSDLVTSICPPTYSLDGVNWYRCGMLVPVKK
jgi:hypothetical protein